VDPVLFEQLFVNLLENAVKYTPSTAAIDVVARRDGDSVLIDVSDRGPGIPSGTEDKVFEKFHRGPHAGVSGAGLGLPICKGIVEAHAGRITVENRTRGGATFHVTIPNGGRPPSLLAGGEGT
jgi:two-component system, OmpR family, sensor histidine kinase KdpD